MARFADGHPGGPGRPKTQGLDPIVKFNLKMAARELCPRAIEVIRECLDSDDERIRLAAATIAFERAFGRPELHADLNLSHAFCVAPEVLTQDEWLAKHGKQLDLKATPDAAKPSDEPDPSKLN
jgi:hypothetical protein